MKMTAYDNVRCHALKLTDKCLLNSYSIWPMNSVSYCLQKVHTFTILKLWCRNLVCRYISTFPNE